MNKPVKYSLAKLLKEKGFDEPCSHAYKDVESPVLYVHQDKKYNNSFKKEWENTVRKNSHMDNAVIKRYSAPTIVEVVMWLLEKHRIWIEVSFNKEEGTFQWKVNGELGRFKEITPERAYEAAIEYCLNKLI